MSRRQKRQPFINWLHSCFATTTGNKSISSSLNRPVRLEKLEQRALMAGDGILPFLGSANTNQPVVGSSTAGLVAEGEAAPDLVAFAKALAQSGTTMYGAYWCPHCLAQKQLFQDGAQFLPYQEMTDANRDPTAQAIALQISSYPTWEFPDGSRLASQTTLETLSARSGVAIPQASKPSFTTIPATTVEVGSPMHVPVDAYDPNGNPLTVTVTSSNPNLISAEVLSGNKTMRVSVKDFGDMVFQLFSNEVPIPTGQMITLAQQGFFNNLLFHRADNGFVIQTGSPAGDGTGGSSLGNINDQFNLNLQHNRRGVLSYAKTSQDDTGDSQFFVTEGPTRFLDFNHAVFGQLIEGEAVREAISNVAVDGNDKPTKNIVIESVTIFDDTENGLVRLKASAGSGTANITVTVSDNEGNTTSQTFVATAAPDTVNGAPFLNAIPAVSTNVNTPVNINLTSQDGENDTVVYSVAKVSSGDYQLSVNASTGVVSVTPATGFTGQIRFTATVQQTAATATDSKTDSQLVTVNVVGTNAPTGVSLDTASDSGTSNSDRITNATAPTFTVSGTVAGAIVKLKVGSTVIGQATATGTTTVVTATDIATVGQGAVLVVATQTVTGAESSASPSVSVTYDTTTPVDVATSLVPSSAVVGQALSVNLAHAEEGSGLVYSIENAPVGMTINAATGVLDWTPTQNQLGARTFSLKLTDAAGNVKTQAFSMNVIEQPLAKVILEVVDMQGNPITQIGTGAQFKVRFLTQDLRGFGANGVFSSYIDLLFDQNVVEPLASNAIAYADPFTNGKSPTSLTPSIAGQINELGAFGSLARTNGDPKLIATVTFTAKAAGNANFRSEAADASGNDILLYDEPQKVALTKVDFGSATLTVGANFQVANDAFNFNEDAGVQSLNVLANDTVSGGAVLTIVSVGTSSGSGTITVASDGKSLNYTPALNFNGAESFTYTVRNQDNVSLTATVTVQVADVNDPPIANNDVFEVAQASSSNVLNVLLNDATGVDAPASETLRVASVGTPSNGGTVQLGSSGLNILYTPAAGFTGTETVSYVLSDGRGGTATATVSITVKVANPPPTPVSDTYVVVEDAAEASFNVLVNDTTEAGETLTISAVSSSTRGSTLRISSDSKQVLYKPGANFSGTEVLNYTLRDSGGATAIGTITFTVTGVNDAPDAVDDTRSILSSAGAQSLDLLTNDINPDTGETLTITAVTALAAGQGTLSITSDGRSVLYTPPSASFTGTVTFSYTISDGNGLTDTAAVTLNVQNYVPRTIGGNLSLYSGQSTASYGGVDFILKGTDITGEAKSFQLSTDTTGAFAQSNLAPGTYTISRTALPFLEDRGDSMTITSAASDSNNTSLKSSIGSLKSQYISIRDFLGSAKSGSVTLAVTAGGSESWYAIRSGFTGFSNLSAQLNAAATTLTVNATNASNQNVSASLPLTGSSSKVTVLASEGNSRLLRINGQASDLGFTVVTTSSLTTNSSTTSSSTAGGEGEGPDDVSPVIASRMSSLPEGEAAPEVEATAIQQLLSPTQALRKLLGSSNSSVSASSSSLVSATTHLLPSAVDSALSEIDTLTLANSHVDDLTLQSDDLESQVDAAFQSM